LIESPLDYSKAVSFFLRCHPLRPNPPPTFPAREGGEEFFFPLLVGEESGERSHKFVIKNETALDHGI
jgi:hypothetical protein